MQVYRTAEERFSDLPDFPFVPHYLELKQGLRVHYVDEGPRDGPVVLLLHGEPTWCYLFRHMIGPIVAAGYRVLAPDLIGFGRSDKPLDRAAYSYAGQVGWMREWIEALDLRQITLGCQDWGSLIGLRLAAEMPGRFHGIALSNGGLPAGQEPPVLSRSGGHLHVTVQFFRSDGLSLLAPVAAYRRRKLPRLKPRFPLAPARWQRGSTQRWCRLLAIQQSLIKNAPGLCLKVGPSRSCAAFRIRIPLRAAATPSGWKGSPAPRA